MYKCNDCKQMFDYPTQENTSYEDYYGVADYFYDKTPLTIERCPYCGSGDFDEYYEEDDE